MSDYYWTDEQFDQMSWHDNYVHAFRIVAGETGPGTLVLDIDHIVEWIKQPEGRFQFRILPATLTFKEVFNLRITLDYATPTAALGPFSIHAIEKHIEHRERYDAEIWTILINWPKGEISFEAQGYEQRGTSTPVVCDDQYLTPDKRQ